MPQRHKNSRRVNERCSGLNGWCDIEFALFLTLMDAGQLKNIHERLACTERFLLRLQFDTRTYLIVHSHIQILLFDQRVESMLSFLE